MSEENNENQENGLIFVIRVTPNKEEQVMEFLYERASRKNHNVYSIVHPNGMKGYIFVEAASREDAEESARGIPYARGVLKSPVSFDEIEHVLDLNKEKNRMNIQVNDIVEIIRGPFKRENAKVKRIDLSKEDVVVELLSAPVAIPITLNMDNVRVIRRETEENKKQKA